MVSKAELQSLLKESLADHLLIVVSNREPYIHTYSREEIVWQRPASGLTEALDPVMRACGGTWIAHGSGEADREVMDGGDKVAVPPDEPAYTLRRVWLSREEVDGHYNGFSNQALWPLCHISYTAPIFNEQHWEVYKRVNEVFTQAVLEEVAGRKALVFIQDYHFALLAKLIKEKAPEITTAQFWHIPWPSYETFRICPWGEEVLDGLLSNDLMGFQIQYHCNNFLDTVNRALVARVDYEDFSVTRRRRKTRVRPFPISVDFERLSAEAREVKVTRRMESLRHELGLRYPVIGLGMDRVDYTKGIPNRLQALDRFLEKNPEYRQKLVFVEFGAPSRTHIPSYQKVNNEIEHLVDEINWKYSSGPWKPIVYYKGNADPVTLHAARRLASFCIVSSLHDGMNLVAKEYVASRADGDGVLILSRFTGAARELTDALLTNPYAIDDFARAIKQAIEMPPEERRSRMERLRAVVRENNIYTWAWSIVSELIKLKR